MHLQANSPLSDATGRQVLPAGVAPQMRLQAIDQGTIPLIHQSNTPVIHRRRAFTLLEVMIACGIFFMATFAILAMVSATLRNARGLQRGQVHAGMAAALIVEALKTNRMDTGTDSGDFGEAYRDYSWDAEWHPYDTNGLLEVNITLNRHGSAIPADSLSSLVYDPNARSGPGSAFLRPR